MKGHQRFLIFVLITFSGFCCFSAQIPDIIIEDTSRKIEIKECIALKSLNYIVYGTPDSLEKNRKELDKVLEFLENNDALDTMLYLVDFRGYMGILHPMIKSRLKKESSERGLIIFADFKGDLRTFLKSDDETILFIILNEVETIRDVYKLKDSNDIINAISKG
jgi:hypothetical protein